MKLEDYFDFANANAIRIKGTRINIEHVLRDYELGASPEELVLRYPTMSLEQVHATILYYLANHVEVQNYLKRIYQQQMTEYQGWLQDPSGGASEFVINLRKRLATEREKLSASVLDEYVDRMLYIPL
jgi:uncharacterized protein (DUF433 family)